MEELLSLKWNNHRSTFLHILAVLRDKQLYTDATLACDGKLYSVHKLVLSTCSDYFSSMLDRTSCKSPVIVLKDIKSEDLEALLDYMYLGEVNVRQSDLATLIKAAECLRVKGLAVADDEPPPRKVRGSDTQGRRGDTSGSPPAKRKRRDIDDGRDDVRPSKHEARHSSPVHSSSNRPKSPLSNNHTSTTNRNSSSNNSISNNINQDSTNTSRQELNNKNSGNTDFDECTPCVKVELEDNQDGVEDTEGDRNVGDTGGDSSTGDLGDSYNLTNEDFKEENDTEGGGDLANDLPEFLQQATSGYSHSSFAGPSFQPELSWQGSSNDGGGLAGSFAAAAASLSFGGSGGGASQDGAGHSNAAGTRASLWPLPQMIGGAFLDGNNININIINNNTNNSSSSSTGGSRGSHKHFSGDEDSGTCDICGKIFNGVNQKFLLRRHRLTHTGERKFSCHLCPYQANQSGNLRRHLRFVHHNALQTSHENQSVSSLMKGSYSMDAFSSQAALNAVQKGSAGTCLADIETQSTNRDFFGQVSSVIPASDHSSKLSAQVEHLRQLQHSNMVSLNKVTSQDVNRSTSSANIQPNLQNNANVKTSDQTRRVIHQSSESQSTPSRRRATTLSATREIDPKESAFQEDSNSQDSVDDSIVCLDSPCAASFEQNCNKLKNENRSIKSEMCCAETESESNI